jgi:hypothetical protein
MPVSRSHLPDAYADIPVADNPTLSTNPFFLMAIREHLDPYHVAQSLRLVMDVDQPQYQGDEEQPIMTKIWTWERFGQSQTHLPDGRKIYIGGEHEDWYDPFFVIFNDVVVFDPATESYDLYRYPKSVFPHTDSHSASYIESDASIWIIGNLGYSHVRGTETPVYKLDTKTFAIHKVDGIVGETPGWISSHQANVVVIYPSGPTGDSTPEEVIVITTMAKNQRPPEKWELNVTRKTWTLVGGVDLSLPPRPQAILTIKD